MPPTLLASLTTRGTYSTASSTAFTGLSSGTLIGIIIGAIILVILIALLIYKCTHSDKGNQRRENMGKEGFRGESAGNQRERVRYVRG